MPSPAGDSVDSSPVYHRGPHESRAGLTDEVRAPSADGKEPPPATEKKSIASAVFNVLMFVVGGCALAWMLRSTSWPELRQVIVGVGAWAALIIVLDLTALCLDAAAWHAFMRPEARMVPYWRVFGAWASGRAINVLTPFGALGEATKVTMLMNHAPRSRVLSSIVLLNVTALYFSVTVMLIGIPITLLLIDLPDAVKVLIGIGVAVIIPLMVGLGFVIQRGAMATMVGTLRRVRLISVDRAKTWKEKLKDVDRHIRELHTHRTAGTRAGFLFVLLSKLVTYTSTISLIHAVGVPVSVPLIIGVVSVGVLIQWISSVVPLGLGLADGGNYVLYNLLGATGEQGLFVTMLNRARSFTIALLGLGIMAGMTVLDRLRKRRIQAKIVELKELHPEVETTAVKTEVAG
jgi:hypothetical protein